MLWSTPTHLSPKLFNLPLIGSSLRSRVCHARNLKHISRSSTGGSLLHHQNSIRPYSLALTRAVPASFVDALSSSTPEEPISLDLARKQHESYEANLRTVLYTLTIPADERYPDCPFIEDTVVAIGKRAVINRIGALSRQGEVDEIYKLLFNMGLQVTDMRAVSESATCDGGDVLVPRGMNGENKHHLFVGMFGRTNEEGVTVLHNAFPDMKVIPVPDVVGDGILHLKSIVTHLDHNTLVAPTGPLADETILAMEAETKHGYTIVRLPDKQVCNLISVNGVILAAETECEETKQILEKAVKERNMELRYLKYGEFAKCDGSLTCCSVLLDLDE